MGRHGCCLLHTMRGQNILGPLIAVAVGAASGYYIFEPIVRQGVSEAELDKMRQNSEDIKKDTHK